MKDDERRTKEMVVRVILFSDRHPDTDAGITVLVGKLKELGDQLEQVETTQRNALSARHASSLDKQRIQRELQPPIGTITGAAALARNEDPSLAGHLRYRPTGDSYDAQLVAARTLLDNARANQDILAKYGVSEAFLQAFESLLVEFEAAVKLGDEGRAAHRGATPNLGALAKQARQVVRTLDARNRLRFKHDPGLLGEWASARTILGRPGPGSPSGESPATEPGQGNASAPSQGSTHGGTPAAGGNVQPAA